jgi:uncharacterized metal-binding protein
MALNYSKEDIINLYKEDIETMRYAQIINTGCKSRIEEIISFAEVAGYKKIGIAHCVSVTREARQVEKMLEDKFEVVTVECKVGRVPKEDLVGMGFGSVCNPILQAKVLGDAKTDFNIVMGLCVGHDLLFAKYSEAPATTLLVKDKKYNNCPNDGIK